MSTSDDSKAVKDACNRLFAADPDEIGSYLRSHPSAMKELVAAEPVAVARLIARAPLEIHEAYAAAEHDQNYRIAAEVLQTLANVLTVENAQTEGAAVGDLLATLPSLFEEAAKEFPTTLGRLAANNPALLEAMAWSLDRKDATEKQ